jgi:hypothetical protein
LANCAAASTLRILIDLSQRVIRTSGSVRSRVLHGRYVKAAHQLTVNLTPVEVPPPGVGL